MFLRATWVDWSLASKWWQKGGPNITNYISLYEAIILLNKLFQLLCSDDVGQDVYESGLHA